MRFVWLLFAVIGVALPSTSAFARKPNHKREFRIGVLVDGEIKPEIKRLLLRTKKETELITRSASKTVVFPGEGWLSGNWSKAAIRKSADQLLADKKVDLIIAFGMLSSREFASRKKLVKPVLIPLAADPAISGLPVKGARSGRKNFSYLVYSQTAYDDLRAFQQLVPTKTVHVLVDGLLLKTVDGLAAAQRLGKRTGLTLKVVPAEPTADATLARLDNKVRAVYLTPLARMNDTERRKLLRGLQKRRLPSFSMAGRAEVERGALATQTRGADYLRAARRTALNIERTMRGEDPGRFPVFLKRPRKLLVNMEVARAIGYSPTWQTLTYAELYKEDANKTPRLTYRQAIMAAVKHNWTLAAARTTLRKASLARRAAYAPLWPQVGFQFGHQTIHKNAAEASNGTQPWHQGKLAGTLSQALLVEPLWAGVTIRKAQEQGAAAELATARLDVLTGAAKAFINLLKAQTSARIQKSNTQLTAANLDAAATRQQVGVSEPSDLYRWQSQLANDRSRSVAARAQVSAAWADLAQWIRYVPSKQMQAAPLTANAPTLAARDQHLEKYLSSPTKFAVFSDFVVKDGLKAAPELKQLEAALVAQRRQHLSRKRALYLPQVQLNGEVSYLAYRKFTDTQPINIPGVGPLMFGSPPRFNWFIGIGLSIPLFTGLDQSLVRDQAGQDVLRLERQLQGAKLQIESRIRAALSIAGARSAAIVFAQRSAKAAEKNLRVTRDAYARGVASTVRLLDAQNQAFAARLAAAAAVYDFHLALIDVQRAIGRFRIFTDQKRRDGWFSRLKQYFSQHYTGRM